MIFREEIKIKNANKKPFSKNLNFKKGAFVLWLLFLFILGILADVFWSRGPVLAQEDSNKKINEINKQIEDLTQKIQEKEKEVKTLQEEIQRLDEGIQKTNLEIEKIKIEITFYENQIKSVEAEIAQKEEEIRYQEQILNRCIESLYQNKRSTLEILLSYSSLNEALSQLDYLDSLEGQAQTTANRLNELKEELLAKKRELEEKKKSLDILKLDFEDKQISLEIQKKNKEDLLILASQEQALLEDQLESKQKERFEILKKLISSKNYNFSSTGNWVFPLVGGTITSCFGYRIHPISGQVSFHKGIDIAPTYSQEIRAAKDGIVVGVEKNCFQGNYSCGGGFGNFVLVYHGIYNGHKLYTIYAHMKEGSVRVEEGQVIAAGDVIGLVGSTGSSTGSHLHFGINFDLVYDNPAYWLDPAQIFGISCK